MKILIGCPVYKRAWLLTDWFNYIEQQTMPLSDLGFIFELGPNDDETHDLLWQWHMDHPQVGFFDGVIREDEVHRSQAEGVRQWVPDDFLKMATLRNHLLNRVTCIGPERYFSLDSDILLTNPNTLEVLYNETKTKHAASPLTYMWPQDKNFPSVMTWVDSPGGRARRSRESYPLGTTFRADIIMAAKMMTPPVYENVRYSWHKQGEDLGWCTDAARQGYELWCVSSLYAEHIMHRWMLDKFKSGLLEDRSAC
jgi:hypothetical protein